MSSRKLGTQRYPLCNNQEVDRGNSFGVVDSIVKPGRSKESTTTLEKADHFSTKSPMSIHCQPPSDFAPYLVLCHCLSLPEWIVEREHLSLTTKMVQTQEVTKVQLGEWVKHIDYVLESVLKRPRVGHIHRIWGLEAIGQEIKPPVLLLRQGASFVCCILYWLF